MVVDFAFKMTMHAGIQSIIILFASLLDNTSTVFLVFLLGDPHLPIVLVVTGPFTLNHIIPDERFPGSPRCYRRSS